MSQLASSTAPVSLGSNAHALNAAQADESFPLATPAARPRKPRTPLSLVVSTPRRNNSSLVVLLFLVIVAALSVVLVMSISVSKGQYELVGLKNEQADLYKANQTLEQDIAAKQAPQELVARAATLGMVPAGTAGQIDVRTGKVSGAPQPASADTKGLASIPPALIDKPVVAAPVAEAAALPLSPAAQDVAAQEIAAKEAAAKTEQTKASATEKDTRKEAAPLAVPPAAVTPELNGGTIPAPTQKES